MSQNYREEKDRQRDRSRQKEHYRQRDNKPDHQRERDRDRKNRDKDRDRERGHRDHRHPQSRRNHDHRRSQRDSGRQGNSKNGGDREDNRRNHRNRHSRRHSQSDERHKHSSRHSNFSGRPHSGSPGQDGKNSNKRVQRELPIIRISNGNGGMVTQALDAIALYANSMLTKMLPVILKASDGKPGEEPLEKVLKENHMKDLGSLGKALKVLISELFPEQNQGIDRRWNESFVLENNKIERRIRIPRHDGVNYFGLLIGPSGVSQKKMEMESGCKILVKGNLPNDKEEPHIHIIGDSQASVSKAEQLINGVLTADERTRELIRDQQTRDAAEMGQSCYQTQNPLNSHLLTPYGTPGADAHIMTIPNDIVGLIIGKGGETIRQLQAASGAKIQVAKSDIPNTMERNVFIEGAPQKEQLAQKLINDIIIDHKKTQMQDQAMIPEELKRPDSYTKHTSLHYPIPLNLTGMVIGRGGDTLKNLMQRTGAIIEVPKNFNPTTGERILTLSGTPDVIDKAKKEISTLLATAKYTKSPITGERHNLNGLSGKQPQQVPQVRPMIGGGMYPSASGLYGPPIQPMTSTGYAGFQSSQGGFLQGGIDPK